MKQPSFYQFLMTKRNPGSYDPVAEFANNAFFDMSFPKQSINFDDISKYLEENADYIPTMTIFDDSWREYIDSLNY